MSDRLEADRELIRAWAAATGSTIDWKTWAAVDDALAEGANAEDVVLLWPRLVAEAAGPRLELGAVIDWLASHREPHHLVLAHRLRIPFGARLLFDDSVRPAPFRSEDGVDDGLIEEWLVALATLGRSELDRLGASEAALVIACAKRLLSGPPDLVPPLDSGGLAAALTADDVAPPGCSCADAERCRSVWDQATLIGGLLGYWPSTGRGGNGGPKSPWVELDGHAPPWTAVERGRLADALAAHACSIVRAAVAVHYGGLDAVFESLTTTNAQPWRWVDTAKAAAVSADAAGYLYAMEWPGIGAEEYLFDATAILEALVASAKALSLEARVAIVAAMPNSLTYYGSTGDDVLRRWTIDLVIEGAPPGPYGLWRNHSPDVPARRCGRREHSKAGWLPTTVWGEAVVRLGPEGASRLDGGMRCSSCALAAALLQARTTPEVSVAAGADPSELARAVLLLVIHSACCLQEVDVPQAVRRIVPFLDPARRRALHLLGEEVVDAALEAR